MKSIVFITFILLSNLAFAGDVQMSELLRRSPSEIDHFIVRDRSVFSEQIRQKLKQDSLEERKFWSQLRQTNDPRCDKDRNRLKQIYERLVARPALSLLLKDELNLPVYAFCDPQSSNGSGGDTIISIGLGILLDAKNDDEVATVLAHEIAHVSLAHDLERRSGNEDIAEQMKRQEREADLVGALIAYLAGYQPQALIMFLQRIDDDGKKDPQGHASPRKRVQLLKRYLKGI